MKLLKKTEIDRMKQVERKLEVDQGAQLAMSIDKLRETRQSEELQLRQWREQAIKSVQLEINQFIEERDNLERRNNEIRIRGDELLKSLNKVQEQFDTLNEIITRKRVT